MAKGTSGPPGLGAALQRIQPLDEALADLLGGEVHVHGAVLGPGLDLDVDGATGGERALSAHVAEVLLDERLGLALVELVIADHEHAPVVAGAHVVEARVEVGLGQLDVVGRGAGGGDIHDGAVHGELRVGDDAGVHDLVVELVKDGLLLRVGLKGLEVGLGGLDGHEQLGGADEGDDAGRVVLDPQDVAGVAARRLDDGGAEEELVGEAGLDLLIDLDVAARVGREDLAVAEEGADHGRAKRRQHVHGQAVLDVARAHAGDLEHEVDGLGDVVLVDELAERQQQVLGDVARRGEVEVAGQEEVFEVLGNLKELRKRRDHVRERDGHERHRVARLEVDVGRR